MMAHLVRAEFAVRRFWSSICDALRERTSEFGDREAGDFLASADMQPDFNPEWVLTGPGSFTLPDTADLDGDPEVELALARCEIAALYRRLARYREAYVQATGQPLAP